MPFSLVLDLPIKESVKISLCESIMVSAVFFIVGEGLNLQSALLGEIQMHIQCTYLMISFRAGKSYPLVHTDHSQFSELKTTNIYYIGF